MHRFDVDRNEEKVLEDFFFFFILCKIEKRAKLCAYQVATATVMEHAQVMCRFFFFFFPLFRLFLRHVLCQNFIAEKIKCEECERK